MYHPVKNESYDPCYVRAGGPSSGPLIVNQGRHDPKPLFGRRARLQLVQTSTNRGGDRVLIASTSPYRRSRINAYRRVLS